MVFDSLRRRFAEELDSPLRVVAQKLAHGMSSGAHRALRKGSGIEFAGHRPYTPGDDLRHLDRHALLRHGRLLIREFHTDTERAIHLLADASSSMSHRGLDPLRPSKAERALLLAAALGFAGSGAGDRVGFSMVGGGEPSFAPPRAGREALERTISALELHDQRLRGTSASVPTPRGSNRAVLTASEITQRWLRTLDHLGARLPRGTVLFVLSDFLDWNPLLTDALVRICTRGRTVRALQVLTRDEVSFPFEGALRLVDPETGQEVETEAGAVRAQYQERLDALTRGVSGQLGAHGGLLFRHVTDEPIDSALYPLAWGVVR